MIDSVELLLNGQDRFQRRNGEFFRYIEPYKRCRNIPDDKSIYNYNFGVNTCQFQPSGYLNFSRIDNSQLNIDLIENNDIKEDTLMVTIYALNYNILRVQVWGVYFIKIKEVWEVFFIKFFDCSNNCFKVGGTFPLVFLYLDYKDLLNNFHLKY